METNLQLVIDNTNSDTRVARAVRLYEALLAEREAELRADLDYYAGKLRDLDDLDPEGRTGLKALYRDHARHIQRLLAQMRTDSTSGAPASVAPADDPAY